MGLAGLARKQRDRLATANQPDRCFGACPTFTTAQASAAWRERRGQAPCGLRRSQSQRLRAPSQSPFSRAVVLTLWLLNTFAAAADAQPNSDPIPDGYVGGPYKVIAADFTGDQRIELAVGYRSIGVLTIEQVDGRGQLTRLSLHPFAVPQPHGERHVHNLDHGDVDKDGLPDLALTIGGKGPAHPGFVVIARNVGQGQFRSVCEYRTPSEAKGIRLADLDNDGRLDLAYTARGSGYKGDLAIGKLFVRQGLADWKFGPAIEADAGKSAYYVDTTDLNNDGFLDMVVPNEHDSAVTYFMNPGAEMFTSHQPPSRRQIRATQIPGRPSHLINDVRAADFNDDGNVDLLTANLGSSTTSLFLGKGDGSFQKDTPIDAGKNGAFLAVGDLDNDGDLDFVVTHWTEDFMSVFLNKSDGTFLPRRDHQTGSGNYGVTLCDVNGDKTLDAVTANYRARSVSVLIGTGDGSFQPAVTTPSGLRSRNGEWTRE